MKLELFILLLGFLPVIYVLGHRMARHLWHHWLACWFTKPLPYTQPDSIGRARSNTACAGERGASLPPRVPRRRRGDDKGPALGVNTN